MIVYSHDMQSISLNNQASVFYSNIANMGLYIYIAYILSTYAIHISGCQPGSVRLVGGSSSQEGRIELCVQFSPGVTVWGSMCSMSVGVAEVVCRQLGYSGSGKCIWSQKYGIVSSKRDLTHVVSSVYIHYMCTL